MFDIIESEYTKIYDMFGQGYKQFLDMKFEKKIKKAMSVLNFKYLYGSCKEAKMILPKLDISNLNLFDLIISIYNKRRRVHQAKFFLLHCFENGLRSTLAINLANFYNNSGDDWFLQTDNEELDMVFKIVHRRCKNENLQALGTFGIFDKFYMIDLQEISYEYWSLIEHIFSGTKEYKFQPLPAYGRQHFKTKISQIRTARNSIFHNNPTKLRFEKDLEILLLRMGYNLQKATRSCDFRNDIKLQYNYFLKD